MTLKQIEYFEMVCEKGNITVAADALYISRSVVSRAILELEEEFETTLFTRSRNGVVLTESGKILKRLFEAFMNSYTTAKERIRRLQDQPKIKPLRLGVTPTNAYCIYQAYFLKFQSRFPYIPLHVEEHGAFEMRDLLLNGVLDAAFTPAPIDKSLFEVLELYQNPIMLGAMEDDDTVRKDKMGIGDILDLPLAFFNAPMPIENILNASFDALELGKKPNVVLRTSDQMLLRELTIQKKVYPILPLDMMATWSGVRQITLDFVQPSINRLVWSRALMPEPALAAFLAFMREQTES